MATWLKPKLIRFQPPLSNLHPLVAGRLVHLGLVTDLQANAFLNPAQYTPAVPGELTGLLEVADRVEASIRREEPICVWGDFDVDGQTSTTILVSMLRDLGASVSFHIPVRGPESHGLNIPILTKIIEKGTKLILTCDTGISANEGIDLCNSRGVDVVITDHHDLPIVLPKAVAIANPKFLPDDHPLISLTGAGVAYKLAEELYSRFGKEDLLEKQLDLVALGLVADVATLKGDARYLVQCGLESLRHTTRIGLRSLMEAAELNSENLTEEHIGFMIAPRLNALGRLDDANISVELLTTSNASRAKVIIAILEGLNARRQLLTKQVYQAAESQIAKNHSILDRSIILLAHPTWPGGIIGIAASHLVDRYHRPVILISNPPGEPARGSARSIEGIDITAAIANQRDMLISYGGHPMAAGLSMDAEKIVEFGKKLEATISRMLPGKVMEQVLQLEGVFDLKDLSMDLTETIEHLAPFGAGNPKPVLATHNLKVVKKSGIGRQKEHLKFVIEDDSGFQQQVLWWDAGNENLPEGKFDLAYTLRASDWKGMRELQLEYIDHRNSQVEQISFVAPTLEVIDHRRMADRQSLLLNLPLGTIIWAEGEEKSELSRTEQKDLNIIKISDRNDLSRADTLVIWTAPASQGVLKTALDVVRPERIILLNSAPARIPAQKLLERLIGLVKYSINHHNGASSYQALASATAQSETTIQNSLEWMENQGMIFIARESTKGIHITAGTGKKDNAKSERSWNKIKILLEETRAYRNHFFTADKNMLFS